MTEPRLAHVLRDMMATSPQLANRKLKRVQAWELEHRRQMILARQPPQPTHNEIVAAMTAKALKSQWFQQDVVKEQVANIEEYMRWRSASKFAPPTP